MNKRLLTMVVAILLSLFSSINLWADTNGVIAQGVIDDNNSITWTLTEDGVLTLKGTGEIPDYANAPNFKATPWDSYKEQIKSLIIETGITKIGSGAFSSCRNLSHIELPKNLKTIASRAFYLCTSLTEIELPEGLEKIGESAFWSAGFKSITLPETLKTIEDNAFGNNKFKELYIPKSVTSIEGAICAGCPLEKIVVDRENTVYRSWDDFNDNKECNAILRVANGIGTLIYGCKNTVIPKYITIIGGHAFSSCDMTEFTVPDNVTEIGEYAFYGNIKLKKLTLGSGLKTIKHYAFMNDYNLESITILAKTPPTCEGADVFSGLADDCTLYAPGSFTHDLDPYINDEIWGRQFQHHIRFRNYPQVRLYQDKYNNDEWTLLFVNTSWPWADSYGELPLDFSLEKLEYWIGGNTGVTKYPLTSIKHIIFDKSFQEVKPISCKRMFRGANNLEDISHLEYLNTEKVTDMTSMFEDCYSLKSLDLSKFNTSKVKYFTQMFWNCNSLSSLDLTSFNTAEAEYMESMLSCENLKSIDLSSFNTSNVKFFNAMFYSVPTQCNIYVSDNFKVNVVEPYQQGAMFGSGTDASLANYITGRFLKKVGTIGNNPIGAKGQELTVKQLTLTEGEDYQLTETEPVTVSSATYSRTMTSKWGDLCLPYPIANDASSDYRFFILKNFNLKESVTLEEITGDIEAGTPVLFCRKDNATNYTATFTGSGKLTATCNRTGWLIGNFVNAEGLPSYFYYLDKDKFHRMGDSGVTLPPYRAYFSCNPSETEYASELRIDIAGDPTSINPTEVFNGLNDSTAEYYNINGMRIDGLQKGMNIVKVGGKIHKVLVK